MATGPMSMLPVSLTGRTVRLTPLEREHLDDLFEIASEPTLWRWTQNHIASRKDLEDYVAIALAERAEGRAMPFVTVECATGRVVGSTRFANIELAHRRLEIGWTWVGQRWQRTGINTEAKFLMLWHAFEILGANRVELKTDALNAQSRAAILRIGATEEGIFRSHMVTHTGRIRDTVYYSIIRAEWPNVKARLTQMMSAHDG